MRSPYPLVSPIEIQCDDCPGMIRVGELVLLNNNHEYVHTVCPIYETRKQMRRFKLVRTVDVTGISGTGVVAEGIEFSDGTTVVRWLEAGVSEQNKARGVSPTTVVHPSAASVIALHGHNGATTIEWIDGEES